MILRICCQESHSCWRGVWWLVKYLVWNLLSFRPYLFRSWIQFVSAKTRRVGTESGHTLPPRKQQTSNNRVSQHESTGRLICWPIKSKPHWLSLAIQQKRKRGVARRDWPARPSPLQSQAENDRVISFHFISFPLWQEIQLKPQVDGTAPYTKASANISMIVFSKNFQNIPSTISKFIR